ncbi:MAG: glycosyltransferase family 39 protein [Patescibacteria group bacterium]
MKVSYILLGIIVVLAAWLRLTNLTSNPPALSWDEVSIGYNANTILSKGTDEHGVRFPLGAFAGFGDYKPSLPIYLTVPFIAVFGLSDLAVRLPSSIFGILTVLLMYFLVKELFSNQRLALLSALFLAISPWHIMLSRTGFEANIAAFFVTLGVYLLLVSRKNSNVLPFAFLPFVLGMYTFNSARYAGPLIAFGVLCFSWGAISKAKTSLYKGLIIAAIALLPLMPHLVSKEARLRFQEVSIFTDLQVILTSNQRSLVDGNSWWSKVVDNRRFGYGREYLVHFLDNVEPRFLFIKGDGNPKFSIQDTGQLLLVTAPFIFIGWLALFARQPKIAGLLLFWLLASIAPAAVARETPHALRVENGLPVWIIITAYGYVQFLSMFAGKKLRLFVGIVMVLLVLGNFGYFWHTYTTHYKKEYSGEWQYGYKEAIEYSESVKEKYDVIVLTESLGRPYIYTLFYGKYDLSFFQTTKDASFDKEGFYNVYRFGKYRFVRHINEKYEGRVLYILPINEVPENAKVLKNISLLNGFIGLVIFEL